MKLTKTAKPRMSAICQYAVTLAMVAASAGASAAILTTPDGPKDFEGFDWDSSGSVLIDGYGVTNASATGTTDDFTLYYQAYAGAVKGPGGVTQSTPGLRRGADPAGYEYTILATLNERVTCLSDTISPCGIVRIDVLGGDWDIYYQLSGDANMATGTGFGNGTLIMSGTFLPGISDSLVGVQGPTNPGNVTLSGTFRGDVTSTNNSFINPDMIDTEAVSTLQFGANTTSWTRPAAFEEFGAIGANTNTTFAGQGDANQVLIAAAVPEPATLALMSLGLLGLGFSRRRA